MRVSPAAWLLLCGVLAAAAPLCARAQDVYDVELIVFRLLAPQPDETAPEEALADPAATEEPAPAEEAGADTNEAFEPLAPEAMQMRETFQRLRNSKDYRPLFHIGWRQQVAGPGAAVARTIGEESEEARVTGRVRVYKQTFVHADVDLTLYLPGEAPHTISDTRRLRSGEMSYFDHARFGALLLVTPAPAAPAATP